MKKFIIKCWILSGALMLFCSVSAQEHQHQDENSNAKKATCKAASIKCAKTVTSAFATNGDLWRVWAHEKSMYFDISTDNGVTFIPPRRVAVPAEKISARNENRPKIAFDNFMGVYLSWATPKEKRFTADVRFSYSANYGQSFTSPVTVNNDGLIAGHSFNELLVTGEGAISIVWLDGRFSYQLKKQGKKTNGSALFLAQANFREGKSNFTNQYLANNTCVCCRIAMDYNRQGNLAILWRHIYGDNIRDFALLTVNEQQTPVQVSFDHWYINGCPHHGGAISIDAKNRYHLIWFNQGDKGKGIYYAFSDNKGITLSTPLAIGQLTAQAGHPHMLVNGEELDIIWLEYTGTEHQLWHQRSVDNGQNFSTARILATAEQGADRPFIIKNGGISYVSWQRTMQDHWFQSL